MKLTCAWSRSEEAALLLSLALSLALSSRQGGFKGATLQLLRLRDESNEAEMRWTWMLLREAARLRA